MKAHTHIQNHLERTGSAVDGVEHCEPSACFRLVTLKLEVDTVRGRLETNRGRSPTEGTDERRISVTTVMYLQKKNKKDQIHSSRILLCKKHTNMCSHDSDAKLIRQIDFCPFTIHVSRRTMKLSLKTVVT